MPTTWDVERLLALNWHLWHVSVSLFFVFFKSQYQLLMLHLDLDSMRVSEGPSEHSNGLQLVISMSVISNLLVLIWGNVNGKSHYFSSSNSGSPVSQVFTPPISPGDMLLEFTVLSLHGSYFFLEFTHNLQKQTKTFITRLEITDKL